MRLDNERPSDNVEDRRSQGGGGFGFPGGRGGGINIPMGTRGGSAWEDAVERDAAALGVASRDGVELVEGHRVEA